MKIISTNNNNTNFGLRIRCQQNAKKLVTYWKQKGFSDERIQKSMNIIEEYANTTTIGDFFRSLFTPGRVPHERLTKYPTIDFGEIKKDKIMEVFIKEAERNTTMGSATSVIERNYTVRYDTDIPNISYQFLKNGIPMPCNKTFLTPLENFVETADGKILEPKDPIKVAKDIIKVFREFKKDSLPPHNFLRPSNANQWVDSVSTCKYNA